MNAPKLLPAPVLSPDESARFAWISGQVLLSLLGPHEKLALTTLVRLDVPAQGVRLSWRSFAAACSLSPSSVRRAVERLGLLLLLRVQHSKTEDDEHAPNLFLHAFGALEHPFLIQPLHHTYQAETLDAFLALRKLFEDTLGAMILKDSPGEETKKKRPKRGAKHAPRPWRQSYGPLEPHGIALLALPTFQWADTKNDPAHHMERVLSFCAHHLSQTPKIYFTPQICLQCLHSFLPPEIPPAIPPAIPPRLGLFFCFPKAPLPSHSS